MTHTQVGSTTDDVPLADAALEKELREALAARAARLGLDPESIRSPSPGALVARAADGVLLRIDFHAYQARDLER